MFWGWFFFYIYSFIYIIFMNLTAWTTCHCTCRPTHRSTPVQKIYLLKCTLSIVIQETVFFWIFALKSLQISVALSNK